MTTLAQLESEIAGMVSPALTLSIDSSTIPSDSVTALFTNFLGGAPLTLNSAKVGFPPNITSYFQILGAGTSSPFLGMTVTINVSQPSDFALVLTASTTPGPDDAPWSFGNAFPALGSPFIDALPSAGFASATFVLSSVATNGLEFNGQLLVESIAVSAVAFLFSNAETLETSGPIESVTDGWPSFSLTAAGNAFIPSVPPLIILSATPGSPNAQSVALAFDVPFAGGITIEVPWPMGNPLTIQGTFDGPPFGLNELARIFDFGPLLPPQLSLPASLGLTGFSVTVDPIDNTIDLVIVAGTPEDYSWEIASFLELTNVQFTFMVNGLGIQGLSPEPGSGATVMVNATFTIGASTSFDVQASFPGFVFSGILAVGDGGLNLQEAVQTYVPDAAALVPALTIDTIAFLLDPNSPSFSLTITAEQDAEWQIVDTQTPPVNISMSGITISVSYAGSNYNVVALGTITIESASFTMAGTYTSGPPSQWQFSGTTNATADLDALVSYFFPDVTVPDLPTVTISLSMQQSALDSATYTFAMQVTDWDVTFLGTNTIPLNGSLTITNTDIQIAGSATFGNLELTATYDVAGETLSVTWNGITGTYDAETDAVSFTFQSLDVGTLVDYFVDAVTGQTGYTLPPPFDLLNSVEFSNVTISASFPEGGGEQLQATATFAEAQNLWFITATGFGFSTDFSSIDVTLDYSSFLGGTTSGTLPSDSQPQWDLMSPTTTPSVPGAGAGMLQIEYLLLAQCVAPTGGNSIDTSSITNAVSSMIQLFSEPPNTSPTIGYSATTAWTIGARLTLLNGTITINAVFIDPSLFGIDISVGGGQFNGLDFEVMYKRVSNTVGVYEIELTLPAGLRQINLGGFAVTLPTVMVQIYTNGNFYVDFGFPYNNDWTQAFAVQMPPFTGLGGFYFGVLNGTTANLPAPNGGAYSPVILIGLAASVGFGDSITLGVLSGSISLTAGGSAQGIFAWFNPSGGGESQLWYQITGQFSLVGRIVGSVNFVILSATFSIVATASVTIQFASQGPVQFTLSASVTVSASIKILFITVSFSFSASVSESFTIGNTNAAQVQSGNRLLRPRRLVVLGGDPQPLPTPTNWAPITGIFPVPLMLTPHITAASTTGSETPVPQIVVMTYVATAVSSPSGESPFTVLAQGALLWSISAILQLTPEPGNEYVTDGQVLASSIPPEVLDNLLLVLQQTSSPWLPTLDQINALLPQLYVFEIAQVPDDTANDIPATVFPILPALTLNTPGGTIALSQYNPVSAAEVAAIQAYFDQLAPPPAQPTARPQPSTQTGSEPSMASLILADYFLFLCRAVVQAAVNTIATGPQITASDTIDSLIGRRAEEGFTPEVIAAWNRLRALRRGTEITLPDGGRYTVGDSPAETLLGVARRFGTTPEDLARSNRSTPGFFADGVLKVPFGEIQNVAALLVEMAHSGAFDAQGGAVARMLLQGLQPPWTETSSNVPLYVLTGQQFDASSLTAGSQFTLQLPEGQSRVVFTDGTTAWNEVVTISSTEAEILSSINVPIDVPLDSASMMDPRNAVAKQWALSAPILWNWSDGSPTWTIWKLPIDLLQTVAAGTEVQVQLVEDGSNTPAVPHQRLTGLTDDLTYDFAVAFPITVQAVPMATNPSTPMSFTYNLLGTDDAGSLLLQNLLQAGDSSVIQQLYVLFPQQPGQALPSAGVTANPMGNCTFFVLQTNFSTTANPADVAPSPVAADTEPLGATSFEMLQAIWECSVVRSGGYYFYYRYDTSGTATGPWTGLPGYLFDSNGDAEITLVATLSLPANGPLTGAMNTVVVQQTFDAETALYLEQDADASTIIQDSVPAYAAGETGFVATRTFSTQTTPVSIPDTYQLLGFQIAGAGGFEESNNAVPLSPITAADDTSAPQTYQTYLPIWSSAADPGTTTPFQNPPPAPGSPYRGVGTELTIDLQWFDLFGNNIELTTPLPPLTQTIGYFDFLIPVSAWPAVAATYGILLSGTLPTLTPTLTINFLFDSTRYQPQSPTDTTWLTAATSDSNGYASIYYQLANYYATTSSVAITVTTTLDQTVAFDATPTLIGFVVQIYNYLQSIVASGEWVENNLTATVSCTVSDNPLPPDDVIFPLLVQLTIARSQFVAPSASGTGDPAVSVTSSVQPQLTITPPSTTPSLLAFAESLNLCFPELLAATGHTDPIVDSTTQQVWLLRFGENGITCTYDTSQPPVFYAMPPLAGWPLSIANVEVPQYVTGQGLQSETVSNTYTNVDVDLLASNFLAAVDQFLTADFAAPAWAAVYGAENPPSPDPVTVVLQAKQTIAGAIARNVAPILSASSPSAAMLAAAQDAMLQEVLVGLSSAYDISALVQFEATASGPSGIPPNLYGQPVAAASANPDPHAFAFSPLSIPLTDEESIVTFAFTTNQRVLSSISLALSIQFNHLQFDIEEIGGLGYDASSWLTFAMPLSQASTVVTDAVSIDLGTVAIPIVLRDFPSPPSLSAQSTAGVTDPDTIEKVKAWEYAFNYAYTGFQQDQVHIAINGQTGIGGANTDTLNLLTALLQFSAVYPQIYADLYANVCDVENPQAPDSDGLSAIGAFSTLAQNVATAWNAWTPSGMKDTTDIQIAQQAVTYSGQDGVLQVDVAHENLPAPFIEIGGYSTQTVSGTNVNYVFYDEPNQNYLSAPDALSIPNRGVIVTGFDVMQQTNASAALVVKRNETYGDSEAAGNPLFVLTTPPVQYITPAVPQLQVPPTLIFDLTTWTTPPASLDTYLQNFFNAFLGNDPPPDGWPIQVIVTFVYNIGEVATVDVTIPIGMMPPTPLVRGSTQIGTLASFVNSWLTGNSVSKLSGTLNFALSLYSTDTQTALPLLVIPSIQLAVSQIDLGG